MYARSPQTPSIHTIHDKTLSQQLVMIDIHVNTFSNLTEGISHKTSSHQNNLEETTRLK